jgi:hypothetical protein
LAHDSTMLLGEMPEIAVPLGTKLNYNNAGGTGTTGVGWLLDASLVDGAFEGLLLKTDDGSSACWHRPLTADALDHSLPQESVLKVPMAEIVRPLGSKLDNAAGIGFELREINIISRLDETCLVSATAARELA